MEEHFDPKKSQLHTIGDLVDLLTVLDDLDRVRNHSGEEPSDEDMQQ